MPTFNPKKIFSLSGTNMNFTEGIRFGDVQVESFEYLDTTGVSGIVPPAAYTSEIFLETDTNILSLGEQYVVLDSASQVSVGELETYSGKAGDLIQLTGDNFYQITDVRFGHSDDLTGQFFVTSPNEINVIVPSGAKWQGISVSSSLRTGLNGSTSESSGISPNEFVIIPDITGLSTGQEISGANVDILGRDFNAVTGVNFNNLNTGITLIDSNTIRAKVPHGDVWGTISLELRSGLLVSGDDNLRFKSLAKITGVGPAAGGGSYSAQTIDSEVTFVESGDFAAISGHNFVPEILYDSKNFDLTSSGYLVGFGQQGSTGLFNIVSSTVMTGKIPSTCPTGKSNIFLYSNHYPEAFPSDVDFLLKYSNPIIDSVNPPSGLPSDTINIIGRNLYGITGFDITGHAVGAGTEYTQAFVAESEGGKSVTVTLGSNLNNVTYEAFYDIALSGRYGNAKMETGNGEAGFMVYGNPSVISIDPSTNISPGATGFISGKNLYSGDLRLSLMKNSMSNIISDLSISGFNNPSNDNNRLEFTFPNTFETGQYRLKLSNKRASTLSNLGGLLDVHEYPVISGFHPGTGEIGETTITVSGAFEQITGLKVGDVLVDSYATQSSSAYVTGIQFLPTQDIASAKIEVLTRGGSEITESGLTLIPGKPKVSGFWIGSKDDKPSYVSNTGDIRYDQVFGENDLINISGQRLNLITGVEFSGEANKFSETVFLDQSYQNLSFQIDSNINNESGLFNLVDYFNRTGDMSKFPTGVNVLRYSGNDNYIAPGQEVNFTGLNMKGASIGFPALTGGFKYVDSTFVSTTNGTDKIKVNVPSGIVKDELVATGNWNTGIPLEGSDYFCALPGINGVSNYNFTSNIPNLSALNQHDSFTVTGANFLWQGASPSSTMSAVSGNLAFITGTGWSTERFGDDKTGIMAVQVAITGLVTGKFDGELLTLARVNLGNRFVGTGNLVLGSPSFGRNYSSSIEAFSDLRYQNYIDGSYLHVDKIYNMINYFPNTLTIQGDYVDVTGFGPSGGITGTEISLSGQGFNDVHDVLFVTEGGRKYNEKSFLQSTGNLYGDQAFAYYSGVGGSIISPAKEFNVVSDTKITTKIPELSVRQRSSISILLMGGTNALVKGFELFVDNQAFVEKVITNDEASPQISSGQVGEYTIEETINGAVWYVTYKKYPDGTKSIVNSFPKAEA